MNNFRHKISFRKVSALIGLLFLVCSATPVLAQNTDFTWASLGLSDEDFMHAQEKNDSVKIDLMIAGDRQCCTFKAGKIDFSP